MIDSCARARAGHGILERVPGRGRDMRKAKHLVRGQVVANRLRITVLTTVALLNLGTLGAGVAVAGLLPARLALWDLSLIHI